MNIRFPCYYHFLFYCRRDVQRGPETHLGGHVRQDEDEGRHWQGHEAGVPHEQDAQVENIKTVWNSFNDHIREICRHYVCAII